MVTKAAVETASLILPHLVKAAQQQETITYGELGKKIDKYHRTIPYVLGYIRDEICMPRGLPLINVLVVNKQTKLPGDNWLPEWAGHLSGLEKNNAYEKMCAEVFAYPKWDELLEELGLEKLS